MRALVPMCGWSVSSAGGLLECAQPLLLERLVTDVVGPGGGGARLSDADKAWASAETVHRDWMRAYVTRRVAPSGTALR
jgi:hypothetical protein